MSPLLDQLGDMSFHSSLNVNCCCCRNKKETCHLSPNEADLYLWPAARRIRPVCASDGSESNHGKRILFGALTIGPVIDCREF
ncbi:hypothetical protein CEXT_432351 [Caerostris extrusa]|uniref:Uncharacterized protein n=1 Tax=Caerostris extrusa TaxID=172846 RepID=A0AAV4QFG7_CAEEX|nr:hypothetical protein CEXT_432351 [Caerostris extrusa]